MSFLLDYLFKVWHLKSYGKLSIRFRILKGLQNLVFGLNNYGSYYRTVNVFSIYWSFQIYQNKLQSTQSVLT